MPDLEGVGPAVELAPVEELNDGRSSGHDDQRFSKAQTELEHRAVSCGELAPGAPVETRLSDELAHLQQVADQRQAAGSFSGQTR